MITSSDGYLNLHNKRESSFVAKHDMKIHAAYCSVLMNGDGVSLTRNGGRSKHMFWWVQLSQLLSCIVVLTIFSFSYNLCHFIVYIYWPIFYGFYNYCTSQWLKPLCAIRLNIIDIHITLTLEEQIYKTLVKLSTKKNVYDLFPLAKTTFCIASLTEKTTITFNLNLVKMM